MMKKCFFLMICLCAIFINAQKDSITDINAKTILTYPGLILSSPPEFPGGHQFFVKKILDNFNPSKISSELTTIEAVAFFTVDESGNMIDIKIESQNEEVKRKLLSALQKISVKWASAIRNGKNAKVRLRQPLVFKRQYINKIKH